MESKKASGVKFDNGKPMFSLIPPEVLFALSKLYTDGAEKYDPRNWEKGMRYMRMADALQRHFWKWMMGFDFDEETPNAHHLIAVIFSAISLYVYQIREIGTDDRPDLDWNSFSDFVEKARLE